MTKADPAAVDDALAARLADDLGVSDPASAAKPRTCVTLAAGRHEPPADFLEPFPVAVS